MCSCRAVCFGEQVLVPDGAPPPQVHLSFTRSGCARSGDIHLVFLESSDPSSTWRKVVRHVGTAAGLCSAESGQEPGRWVRPSGVGSSRPGGVPQSLHDGPFPTAPSRLIPSAHGEFWARASGPQLAQVPNVTTHCLPLPTDDLRSGPISGSQTAQVVGAHLGRWSTQETVQARIDPSKTSHWRVRIATHFLPVPASSCIIACCEGLSAAGKSSRCQAQCCAATRGNGLMGGALLGPLPERGNFCKRRRGEGSSPTQNNRSSGVEAWCLSCLSRLSVRGKGRAKQRRQQFCCSQRVQDPSCLRATSTAPGDPGVNIRPFSLLGSPHCRLESVRDDVNAGQEREHGQQDVASPSFTVDEQATDIRMR